MEKSKFRKELEKFAYDRGAHLFGIADVRDIKKEFHFLDEILKDLDYAISIGLRLSGSILEEIADSPTKIYYHHYRQANMALDQIAFRITGFIQSKGYRALPVPASQILDWEKQNAHLSHKEIARLAGLGFIGRNNLLVNPKFGSRIRLVSILTDMPLKIDMPLEIDCGDCKACIEVCPAGAIKENKEDFDHMRCYEKLREFRRKKIVDQFICGVCVKACKGQKTCKKIQ
ncbi:MAG: hypothetical protein KJ952_05380 [Candidatus Omnitrophica bacterium]|nr:hypothetical protein [Candidatus Omnitrophota bacterium]